MCGQRLEIDLPDDIVALPEGSTFQEFDNEDREVFDAEIEREDAMLRKAKREEGFTRG